MSDYIERRDNLFYFSGTRIPLEVVVVAYKNGQPVEEIARAFPALSLERIHGGLAFYHANKDAVESVLHDSELKWAEFRANYPVSPSLKDKLEIAQRQLGRNSSDKPPHVQAPLSGESCGPLAFDSRL